MTHPTEEDLVLHYYGEHDDPAAVAAHLEGCPACRGADEALRADLDALALDAPTRDAGYGERVWRAVGPRLEAPPTSPRVLKPRPLFRRFAGFAALAAALVVAFVLGRVLPRPEDATKAKEARDRILLLAVERHLDRSQMMLVELTHADADGPVDVASRAAHLVAENRLYRQTAEQAGEAGLASVLDDLERVLVEAANTPGPLSPEEVRDLNERIEKKGLLFEVRVLSSDLRERQKEIATGSKSSL